MDARDPALDPLDDDGPFVIVGVGVTGAAVARALVRRGIGVCLVDDAPSAATTALAAELGVELVGHPTPGRLDALISSAAAVVPAPGLPEQHPTFALARERRVPLLGELDLAAAWDARPCVAITGTDGKTTVTTLVTSMLVHSGVAAVEAGNTEVPLIAAIDDPRTEVFVVEASSFRLAPLRRFAPVAGCWLNFGPDHQDVHADLGAYETAKARIWRDFGPDQLAVANRDDPVVWSHARGLPRVESVGLGPVPEGERGWRLDGDRILDPDDALLCTTDELHRSLPHDLTNAMAAAATARAVGATPEGTRTALRTFTGLPHRVQWLGERDGVAFYDDSKATAPHATLAAVAGFASVVLIAGGRNKGLDLGALTEGRDHLVAVVAIGEAASEVEAAFAGVRPVRRAESMDEAVAAAAELARPGDVVLLSPACASFDWYGSYAERGEDFAAAAVRLGVTDHPRPSRAVTAAVPSSEVSP